MIKRVKASYRKLDQTKTNQNIDKLWLALVSFLIVAIKLDVALVLGVHTSF